MLLSWRNHRTSGKYKNNSYFLGKHKQCNLDFFLLIGTLQVSNLKHRWSQKVLKINVSTVVLSDSEGDHDSWITLHITWQHFLQHVLWTSLLFLLKFLPPALSLRLSTCLQDLSLLKLLHPSPSSQIIPILPPLENSIPFL